MNDIFERIVTELLKVAAEWHARTAHRTRAGTSDWTFVDIRLDVVRFAYYDEDMEYNTTTVGAPQLLRWYLKNLEPKAGH